MQNTAIPVVVLGVLALAASGCASKKYVEQEVTAAESRVESRLNERVDTVASQVEENQVRLDEQAQEIEQLSQAARDALARAEAAGKLAEGKFVFETMLTDESVKFDLDETSLTPRAEADLAEFADRLAEQNANVFIEIQGHTDSTGSESYNERLGERRAESVKRYLSREAGVPLHRMATISYGESAPIADNATAEGRARNRRVVLVVLK